MIPPLQAEPSYCIMLNNLGVHYIQSGDLDLAIETLRECMSTVRAALPRNEEQQQQQNGTSSLSSTTTSENVCRWFIQCSKTAYQHDHHPKMEEDDDGSEGNFIYRNPVSIPENDDSTEDEPPNQQPNSAVSTIHAIVTMFNLAICYHLKGLGTIENGATIAHKGLDDSMEAAANANTTMMDEEEERRKKTNTLIGHHYLTTSMALYQYCAEMIQLENISAGPYFSMTLANNIGSIHSVFGDEEQAKVWFQQLLSAQMLLVDHKQIDRYTGRNTNTIDNNNRIDQQYNHHNHSMHTPFDGFWYNTSRLVLSQSTSPAA